MAQTIEPVNISVNVGIKDALRDLKSLSDAVVQLEKIKTKASQNIAKAQEKSSKDQVKSTQQAVKEETSLTQVLERTQVTSMARIIRAHEKAEQDKAKATERANSAQVKSYEKTSGAIMKMMRENARREAEVVEQSARARQRFAENTGRRFANGIGRGLGAAAGLGTAAIGIMGGFGIADSVRDRANVHGLAAGVALQGSKTGGQQFNTQDVLGASTSEAIRSGRSTEETIKALGKFTDLTGNLAQGKEMLKTISDYADASGASLVDMAGAAGELFNSGTIKNAKELAAALGTYVEMGKSGAVELKDFGKGFAKITATAGRFGGGSKLDNAYTFGAIAEIAKQHGGAFSPTVALTSVNSFGNDVFNHFKGIQDRFGIKLRDKNGDMRSAQNIITDIAVGSKGRPESLKGLFGAQGVRALNGSIETYNNAIKGATGSPLEKEAIGRAAVEKEFTDLTKNRLTAEKAAEDASKRRAEADRKFASAMENLKATVGEALLPEIIKLIPELAKLTPMIADAAKAFAKLIGWFAQNPFTGMSALIGAFLIKELGMAFALAGVERGVTAGVIGTGNALAATGVLGKASIIARTAGAAGAAGAGAYGGAKTVDQVFNDRSQGFTDIQSDIEGVGNVAKKIYGGRGTSEDMKAAREKLAQLEGKQSRANATNTGFIHTFDTGVGAASEYATGGILTGNKYRDEAKQVTNAQQIKDSDALRTSIDMLRKVIQGSIDAQGGGQQGGNAPNLHLPQAARGGSNG